LGHIFRGKKILVGVTGSIAAYKSCELVSFFVKEGAQVKVVMTGNAARFVSPLTLESLSGQRTFVKMFGRGAGDPYAHLDLAKFPDAAVIAPATANIIGKLANGIADDLLSTLVLALECPLVIVPAMNTRLYVNQAVQENIKKLSERGVRLVPPEAGPLACGDTGEGRLASLESILEETAACLVTAKDLAGKKVLVTAGRTEEPIDPVRFITNNSSGKMGYAVARAARRRGAEVTLVSGPSVLPVPYGLERIAVRTAGEMEKEVLDRIAYSHILVMVAAVGDYAPASVSRSKMQRGKDPVSLELLPTNDILKQAKGRAAPGTLLVGFALEYENEMEKARRKLADKSLDMIVVNNPGVDGAGFGIDTNKATILTRNKEMLDLPLMTKDELADRILDIAVRL
jgi:phosphopantothenoylcysteine decarboxylase/phosphopantothenate--cysteine ligase